MKYLITLIGPTAIGKTALSIGLAKHYGCDIVSCDSRQFFKEMSIGTAVPNAVELAMATHHFIQNKSIFENYSVGDYEKDAIAKLEELFLDNDYAILVGGSGLYVDAVLKGFDDFPEIELSVRENVRRQHEEFGIGYLQDKFRELDPEYFNKLESENPQTLLNPQRMMRFVEVCIGSGKPYSSYLNQKKNLRSFTPIVIGLEAERNVMYERINERVDIMMSQGLAEEVKSLYPNKELNALQTVGYRELFQYFDGNTSLENAVEEIKKNTRRFAKRQLTWFRRITAVKWFDYETPLEQITAYMETQTKRS